MSRQGMYVDIEEEKKCHASLRYKAFTYDFSVV